MCKFNVMYIYTFIVEIFKKYFLQKYYNCEPHFKIYTKCKPKLIILSCLRGWTQKAETCEVSTSWPVSSDTFVILAFQKCAN
jgi:hypothetical protein